jgi:A/G-specific adenine glycosylase
MREQGNKRGGELRAALLGWYDRHRRRMPWRALPGEAPDPYRVWLSEIMLQQTTVAAVGPYFENFTARWPTVHDLAAADLDAVLTAWAGLGYYARARNMHACAKTVSAERGGVFPSDEESLRALPGIGAYTAAAIRAIAFDQPASVVDGNVERVMARLFAVEDELPGVKPRLVELAGTLAPTDAADRPGDYAQALMDLGATICTPRSPACALCPWSVPCEARAAGIAAELPRRAPKKQRPTRYGVAFWAERPDGAVLLRRREEKGLLGGMMEFPGTEWRGDIWAEKEALPAAPIKADWQALPGSVPHTFTHFHLELTVMAAKVDGAADGVWAKPDAFGDHALPSVMRKVAKHALKGMG